MDNGFSLRNWLFPTITDRVFGLRICYWLHQCDKISGTTLQNSQALQLQYIFSIWHGPETNVPITMRATLVTLVAATARANFTHIRLVYLEDEGVPGVDVFEDQ